MLTFHKEMPYGAYFEVWYETVRQMSIDKTMNEGIYFEEKE